MPAVVSAPKTKIELPKKEIERAVDALKKLVSGHSPRAAGSPDKPGAKTPATSAHVARDVVGLVQKAQKMADESGRELLWTQATATLEISFYNTFPPFTAITVDSSKRTLRSVCFPLEEVVTQGQLPPTLKPYWVTCTFEADGSIASVRFGRLWRVASTTAGVHIEPEVLAQHKLPLEALQPAALAWTQSACALANGQLAQAIKKLPLSSSVPSLY